VLKVSGEADLSNGTCANVAWTQHGGGGFVPSGTGGGGGGAVGVLSEFAVEKKTGKGLGGKRGTNFTTPPNYQGEGL